jgi:hypothetical protein
MTEVDETGDWTTFDKYSVDKNETLTTLDRTIDIADGLREEQFWTIRNGEATKQKSTAHSLITGEVVPNGKFWIPSTPVITKLQAFPFWPFVRDKRQEIQSRGSVCMPNER